MFLKGIKFFISELNCIFLKIIFCVNNLFLFVLSNIVFFVEDVCSFNNIL